ncbi:hypothetical protein [Filobacillus milosensis]|nr:hypothetical protein [Filobacillus milosensis]
MNRVFSNSAKMGMGAAMGWMMRNKAFRKSRMMKRFRKVSKKIKKQYF